MPGILLALLIGLPILAILIESFGIDLKASLVGAQAQEALKVSLLTSVISTAMAILFGTPLAYVLARSSIRGKAWVELLVDLPIVLPPSVAGLGLLLAFGRQGLLGSSFEMLGISLPFSLAAVVLAQVFVASPLFVRSARIGFASVNRHLQESAITEGASQWQMFWKVMMPLSIPALFTGTILTLARALGEFGATILFAGNLVGVTQTIPLAIYIGLESNREAAIALSILLLGVSGLFLIILRRIEKIWERP